MSDQAWTREASDWLRDQMQRFGGAATVEPAALTGKVADETTKWTLRDAAGRPVAVAIGSSAADPGQAGRAAETIHTVRAALRPPMRDVVLPPLFAGDVGDRSVAAYPYCRPLASSRVLRRVAAWSIREPLLRWLYDVARHHATPASTDELDTLFREPLRRVAEDAGVGAAVNDAAARALRRLDAEQWRPRCVIAHNDLWRGNILRAPRTDANAYGFVLVDWAGGKVRGAGVYDLVRASLNLRIPVHTLRRELHRHAEALRCEERDVRGHLLAALGQILCNPGCFPYERFCAMARECFAAVDAARPIDGPRRREEREEHEAAELLT